jgi:hypothetical protein
MAWTNKNSNLLEPTNGIGDHSWSMLMKPCETCLARTEELIRTCLLLPEHCEVKRRQQKKGRNSLPIAELGIDPDGTNEQLIGVIGQILHTGQSD